MMVNKVSPNWILVFAIAFMSVGVIISLGNSSGIDSANIANESIIEEDLKFVGLPADNECATYDAASGGFDWDSCGAGGGGTHPVNLATDVSGQLDVSNNTNLTASNGGVLVGDDVQTTLGTTVDVTTEIVGIVPVSNGGTGVISATNENVLIGNGTGFDPIIIPICDTSNVSRLQFSVLPSSLGCSTSQFTTADIFDNSLLPADLNSVDTPADEECVTYEASLSSFEYQACGGGGSDNNFTAFRAKTAGYRYGLGLGINRFSGSRSLIADTMFAFPFSVGSVGLTVDEFWTFVNSASATSSVRFCIYDDSNSSPGTLVRDAGIIDSSTTGDKTNAFTATTLTANSLYWFVFWSDITPQLLLIADSGVEVLGYATGGNANMGVFRVLAFGACPATFGAATSYTTTLPIWGGVTEQ